MGRKWVDRGVEYRQNPMDIRLVVSTSKFRQIENHDSGTRWKLTKIRNIDFFFSSNKLKAQNEGKKLVFCHVTSSNNE
jgi:hypothetical protein